MKKLFLLCLLTSFFVLNAFDPPFSGDSRPPRSIRIGNGTFAEFKPGMRDLEIVVEENAYKTTRFAASELQKFLEQRLKTKIPVVNSPGEGKISICLGINRWSREAGIADSALCRDAFIIRTSGRKIFILGKDDPKADPVDLLSTGHHLAADQCYQRATLFGVYDFLERFAGIRFFFPCEEGIVIPKGAFRLPETDIYDRPDFECRWHSPYNGYWRDELADPSKCRGQVKRRGRMATPEKNLSWYRNRMQTRHIANSHGLALLNLKRRFHQSHPEYFALKANGTRSCDLKDSHSGQLCFSSGVGEVIFQDAKAYLTGQPAKSRNIPRWSPQGCNEGMFSVMLPDGFSPCHCPACWKDFSQGRNAPSTSNRIWRFTCDIARRLQQEKIPGYLLFAAYEGYKAIPDVEIPSNLWFQVCVEGPWGERHPEIQKDKDELVRNWVRKRKGKVWLWNYALKWGVMSISGVPSGAPRAFAKYYKKMAPYIYGAFVESGTDHFIFHYLTYYVYGKIAWNNQVDADQLLKDHAQKMFGPGAPEMEQFLDRFEYLWLNRVLGKTVNTPLGPVAVTASAAELWEDIYSETELASLRNLLRKAEQAAAGHPEELKRIRFVGNAFLVPVEKELKKNQFLKKSIAAFSAEVIPCREKVRIDGKLDDPVWKHSPVLYMQPFKKRPDSPADETLVRLARDNDFLYVSFECREPQIDKIRAPTRENPNNGSFHENSVEIFLNPDCRKLNCLQMIVNSNGVPFLMKWIVGGNKFVPDAKWDADFRIGTQVNRDSWCAEIAIPLSSLKGFDGRKMLANFTRNQVKDQTDFYSWSPFMENNFQEIRNFGTLLFQPSEKKNLLAGGNFAGAKRTPRRLGSWGITKADAAVGKIELDRTTFISGGASLKLSGLKDRQQRTGIVQPLQLKPRTRYVLSFYARSENVVPFERKTYGSGAAAILRYDRKNHTLPLGWITGTTPWTLYVFEFQTGEAEQSGSYILLRLAWSAGTVWFDNITVHEM